MQLADGTTFASVHVEARMQLPDPGQGLWVSRENQGLVRWWQMRFCSVLWCAWWGSWAAAYRWYMPRKLSPQSMPTDCILLPLQPAFWMFPTELKYGVWAASGEVR